MCTKFKNKLYLSYYQNYKNQINIDNIIYFI